MWTVLFADRCAGAGARGATGLFATIVRNLAVLLPPS
jgi:hypothetical protein